MSDIDYDQEAYATAKRKEPPPRFFSCCVCGGYKVMEKMAGRQKYCQTKCEPMPGLELVCTCCGESKPFASFSDYREAAYGRIMVRCKACQSKANLKPVIPKTFICRLCGEKKQMGPSPKETNRQTCRECQTMVKAFRYI